MPRPPLATRLYQQPALYEAARIIGYQGIEFSAFWGKAKELRLDEKVGKQKLLNAVYDLTRADQSESTPPRYELTAPARQACFQLLGPPPEHPLYA